MVGVIITADMLLQQVDSVEKGMEKCWRMSFLAVGRFLEQCNIVAPPEFTVALLELYDETKVLQQGLDTQKEIFQLQFSQLARIDVATEQQEQIQFILKGCTQSLGWLNHMVTWLIAQISHGLTSIFNKFEISQRINERRQSALLQQFLAGEILFDSQSAIASPRTVLAGRDSPFSSRSSSVSINDAPDSASEEESVYKYFRCE